MASTAAEAASLQRPESDLDGSSSYVGSLASPTTRDSLDEGYDPDETLKVIVYDNEEIKIKSSGMYYDTSGGEEDNSDSDTSANEDDKDVVFVEQHPELRQSKDDDQDVVYVSSGAASSRSVEPEEPEEQPEEVLVNPIPLELHQSYEDSADVELVPYQAKPIQLHSSYEDSQDVQLYPVVDKQATIDEVQEIDAFEQFEHGDIVEIEPGKFCMVKSDESDVEGKIELLSMKSEKLDYGANDNSASVDDNVKVCTDILKNISFDEISLSSIKKLRAENKKLRRMSHISSLDSDTKVFNEIWNAVKQDKFDSGSLLNQSSLDSDAKVFHALNKSLSSDTSSRPSVFKPTHPTIPEVERSCSSSVGSWSLPENPGTSPVYYPASQPAINDPDVDVFSPAKLSQTSEAVSAAAQADKSISVLREHCTSRTDPCSCDVITPSIAFFFTAFSQQKSFNDSLLIEG